MESCLDKDQVRSYARTYAKAVAGLTNLFSFNQTTLTAVLKYEIDPSISEPTIIFASQTWNYVNGFEVTIEPLGKAIFTLQDKDHILITHVAPVTKSTITVTITPTKAVNFASQNSVEK